MRAQVHRERFHNNIALVPQFRRDRKKTRNRGDRGGGVGKAPQTASCHHPAALKVREKKAKPGADGSGDREGRERGLYVQGSLSPTAVLPRIPLRASDLPRTCSRHAHAQNRCEGERRESERLDVLGTTSVYAGWCNILQPRAPLPATKNEML